MRKLRNKFMQDLVCSRKHPKVLASHLHDTHDNSILDADYIGHAHIVESCHVIATNPSTIPSITGRCPWIA